MAQKIYHLMATAPGRVSLNGQEYSFFGGQTLKLNGADYQALMNGPYRSRFSLYHEEEVEEAKSEPTVSPLSVGVDEVVTQAEELLQSEPETAPPDNVTDLTHLIPFEEGASWQKVRMYVLDLEERVPIPYDLIEATKKKFPNYPSVQKECDRILAERDGEES